MLGFTLRVPGEDLMIFEVGPASKSTNADSSRCSRDNRDGLSDDASGFELSIVLKIPADLPSSSSLELTASVLHWNKGKGKLNENK